MIENKRIVALAIKNTKTGKHCFVMNNRAARNKLSALQMEAILNLCNETNSLLPNLLKYYEKTKLDDLTEEQAANAIELLESKIKKVAE